MSIGNRANESSLDTRIYWRPTVVLIWFGAVIMAFGGLVSLSDRGLRAGVARRLRKLAGAVQPAE
jgi:cytochrome c-type biogenesis protein CcmF